MESLAPSVPESSLLAILRAPPSSSSSSTARGPSTARSCSSLSALLVQPLHECQLQVPLGPAVASGISLAVSWAAGKPPRCGWLPCAQGSPTSTGLVHRKESDYLLDRIPRMLLLQHLNHPFVREAMGLGALIQQTPQAP